MYKKDTIDNFSQLKKYTKYLKGINGFIAGGCFKNIFKNQDIRDIDIFFYTKEDFENALSIFERKYKHLYENENCVAFKCGKFEPQVELIKSRFGTPEEILNVFDFTIVKAALVKQQISDMLSDIVGPQGDKEVYEFVYHDKFFEHLMLNRCVIDDQIFKSEATFNRALKYAKYGYGLCRGSKVKLLEAIGRNVNPEAIDQNLYFGWD